MHAKHRLQVVKYQRKAMFRIGLLPVRAATPVRSVRSFLGGVSVSSRLNAVTCANLAIKGQKYSPTTTRLFHSWRKVVRPSPAKFCLDDVHAKSSFKQIQPIIQQRFATFNQLGRNGYSRSEPNYNNVQNNIVKPFIFVTIFTVVSYFAMPYLFDYTPLAAFKRNPQLLIWTIIGLNAVVFGLWQIRYSNAFLYKTLENYFIMDRSALTRHSNWSLILSSFSHQEPFHILVNMACLYSFSGSMISMLGVTGFTNLYLISGAWASFFSLAYSQIFRYFGRSLGASGSISGVFTAFATMFPAAGISFFFIPIPGGASVAAGLFALYNVVGCVLRWGNFDYAAHLGGMWVGFLWGMFLKWRAERDQEERRNRLRRYGF